MFSCCCLGIPRGSEAETEKSGSPGEGHGSAWRLQVNSWLRGLWRETNTTQGGRSQDHTDQAEKESAPTDLKESCRKPCFGSLEEVVDHVVTSLQDGEIHIVFAFLCSYQRYVTTQQVLDALFKRYGNFCPHSKEDEEVKNTICTFLDTWIDKYPQDFRQNSDLSFLKQVKNYLIVNMPYSDLLVRVHELLTQLQAEMASESETTDKEASEMPASTSYLTVITSEDVELKAIQSPTKTAILELEAACMLKPENPKTKEGYGTCATLEADEAAAAGSPYLLASVDAVSPNVRSRAHVPPPAFPAERPLPHGKALSPFYPLAIQYITAL